MSDNKQIHVIPCKYGNHSHAYHVAIDVVKTALTGEVRFWLKEIELNSGVKSDLVIFDEYVPSSNLPPARPTRTFKKA